MTRIASLLLIALLLASCGPTLPKIDAEAEPWAATVAKHEAENARKDAAEAHTDAEAAKRRLDAAQQELIAARLNLRQATENESEAKRQAFLLPLLRVASITAATALLGLFACVVLYFLLPVGTKRGAVIGGGACLAVLIVAVFVHVALPYLWLLGGLLTVGLVGWLVWRIFHTQKAAAAASTAFDRLEASIHAWQLAGKDDVEDMLGAVKQTIAREQDEAGVRTLIAGLRGKPVAKAPTDLDPHPDTSTTAA